MLRSIVCDQVFARGDSSALLLSLTFALIIRNSCQSSKLPRHIFNTIPFAIMSSTTCSNTTAAPAPEAAAPVAEAPKEVVEEKTTSVDAKATDAKVSRTYHTNHD